ncbi:MAG: dCTP deaminase [Patescibacteria group bacterium]|nr:dCTP deaminase [Patescibacteria group bacterium]
MFLSHQTITKYLDEGLITVQPEFEMKDIRPAGIRLHLGKGIFIPESGQTVELGGGSELQYKEIDISEEPFILAPNEFVLGATYESIKTPPNILAILDGRSTVARLGLTVHATASICDGTLESPQVIVLEIKNIGNFNLKLKFKDPIAMMVFAELNAPVTQYAQTQYLGWGDKLSET